MKIFHSIIQIITIKEQKNKGYTENGFAERVFHIHIRLFGDNVEIAFRDLTDANNFVSEDILELIADLLFSSVEFPFVKKYDYISSYLKKRKIQNIRYENGISIIDGPIFTEGKHIFIPCFAQNIFPQSFKDNEYISDDDKKELGVLTSLEKCRTEDAICRDFLFSNNNFYLSRSSAAFSERFFPSPFVKSLGIDEVEVKDLPDVIYSKKYAEYRLGMDKDNKLYFLQHSKNMKSLEIISLSEESIFYCNQQFLYYDGTFTKWTELKKLYPEYGILSEETFDNKERLPKKWR